jgi:hypothetical protein
VSYMLIRVVDKTKISFPTFTEQVLTIYDESR